MNEKLNNMLQIRWCVCCQRSGHNEKDCWSTRIYMSYPVEELMFMFSTGIKPALMKKDVASSVLKLLAPEKQWI